MAQVNFEDALRNESVGSNSKVEFFSLKNNGDEAIVRFMHDSTATFDIVTTHPTEFNGKYAGRVNCIRNANDPIDACPLCAKGIKVEQKFYIHMVQYEKGEDGNIVAIPKVWERSLAYAKQLKDLLTDYGPLSDCLFKIRRNGEPGDMKTQYSITICMPNLYPQEMYPVDKTVFEGYTAVGNAVMDRSFNDLLAYATTGQFPQKDGQASDSVPEFPTTPMYQNTQQQFAQNVPPAQFTPVQTQYTQPYQTVGSEMNGTANLNPYQAGVQGVPTRPVRTYSSGN